MNMKKYLIDLFVITSAVLLHAQQVIRIENLPSDLSVQFNEAFNRGETFKDFWIGYSIMRNSDREVMIGSFYFADKYQPVTLRDIIMNKQKAIDYFSHFSQTTNRGKFAGRSFRMINGTSINDKGIPDRETAILFRYDKNSKSVNDFREINISDRKSVV